MQDVSVDADERNEAVKAVARELAMKLMLWPRRNAGGCTWQEIDAATAEVEKALERVSSCPTSR